MGTSLIRRQEWLEIGHWLIRRYNRRRIASINLTGNTIDQSIIENAGTNIIDGKGGSDGLWGLGGNDRFFFSAALGPTNVDRIYDFDPIADTIRLDDAIFGGLSLGSLSPGAFALWPIAAQADGKRTFRSQSWRGEISADGLKARSPEVAASALLVVRRADLQLQQRQGSSSSQELLCVPMTDLILLLRTSFVMPADVQRQTAPRNRR